MSHSVGETVVLDGIESVIIYDNGSEADWGRYICVDKNHDLVWYISGHDFQNESESLTTINKINKYGYEWGGYGVETGIIYTSIGTGLTNTNSLIALNLQPNTLDWYVVWDKVAEFRNFHSDKWFVPSKDELNLIYENKNYLNGLTTINNPDNETNPYYCSSSEKSNDNESFYYQDIYDGVSYASSKYFHYIRTRLCRYTTDSELNSKTIQITSTTDQASIYYTIDNSTPTSNSTLYKNTFQVQTGTTIKAIGIKEGYIDSDIATLTV